MSALRDVKLADFGFGARTDAPASERRAVVGTYNYWPPEIRRLYASGGADPLDDLGQGGGYDEGVDVWSLGCVVCVPACAAARRSSDAQISRTATPRALPRVAPPPPAAAPPPHRARRARRVGGGGRRSACSSAVAHRHVASPPPAMARRDDDTTPPLSPRAALRARDRASRPFVAASRSPPPPPRSPPLPAAPDAPGRYLVLTGALPFRDPGEGHAWPLGRDANEADPFGEWIVLPEVARDDVSRKDRAP